MNTVNSMRPEGGTSLRALSEVRPVAHVSCNGKSLAVAGGAGQRDNERVLKETVSERKAATSPSGGWRQNGRKRKRGKQGDLLGSTRSSWPQGPKSRPAGVRASIVARKRVTSVEPRDVGKWKNEEQNNGRHTNASARKGYAVAGAWPSAIDSESTERLADILVRGTCPHLAEKPLTGKPDAGDPPVRFGGRGGANPPSLPLSMPVGPSRHVVVPSSCAQSVTGSIAKHGSRALPFRHEMVLSGCRPALDPAGRAGGGAGRSVCPHLQSHSGG